VIWFTFGTIDEIIMLFARLFFLPDTGLRIFPHKRHRRMYFFRWHSCCIEWSPQNQTPHSHCAAFCDTLANYAWKKNLIDWL